MSLTVCPGPVRTPLSTTATEAAATRHATEGSPWQRGLFALVRTARAYVGTQGMAAEHCAEAIAEVVHALEPPDRTTINYTLPMRLAASTPQWLLDAVAYASMRPTAKP